MAAFVSKTGPEDPKTFRKFMGPGQVCQSVGAAIQMCWMMLPADRRTIGHLEKEFRRIVDRAFKDMREDESRFGGKS